MPNTPIATIYKATNILIPTEMYIGHDKNWPDRKKDHWNEANNKNKKNYWYEIHKAIRKYGWDNFEWEIIYQTHDYFHSLNVMEPHFIKEYNSYYKWENGGYNMTLGGDGFIGNHTDKQKALWSIERKGEGNGMFGLKGNLNPNFGKSCHTEEHKENLSVKMQGNIYGIYQGQGKENIKSKTYTVFFGEHKITFTGMRYFCKKNDLNQGAMTRVQSGKQISHKGYTKYPTSQKGHSDACSN